MNPSQQQLLDAIVRTGADWADPDHPARAEAVRRTLGLENRFTEEALAFAINQQMQAISGGRLEAWVNGRKAAQKRVVGVLNAGNVPLVELQDYLATVLVGHAYLGVLSSRSPHLLPAFHEEVGRRAGAMEASFTTADDMLGRSDAVIATGTDETRDVIDRACEERGIPPRNRLLRGNRFAVAVLTGNETVDDLEGLAEDTLLHEGQGCRNVALIWAPKDHSPDALLEAFANFRSIFPVHRATSGALAMPRAFLEAVGTPHAYGEGLEFLLSKGEPEVQQPGHVRWVEYADVSEAGAWIQAHADQLQAVVGREEVLHLAPRGVARDTPGTAQRPAVDWCPDGRDVIEFLLTLA